jgi:hypothetical protein
MLKGRGILSPLQRVFLGYFAGLPDQEHFYLTEGTALAEYYLGHRFSFDLDLFTSEADLILPISYRIEQTIPEMGMQATVVRRFASFVEFQVIQGDNTLKVDLALDSRFRFAPVEPGDCGVMVNNFQDIQTDKTLAFFGRAEPRDAIDLYFLLRQTGADTLIDLARQKDPGFDTYWFALALNKTTAFPDEIERWPVKMLVDCDPIDLKRSFQKLATDLMSKYTGQS